MVPESLAKVFCRRPGYTSKDGKQEAAGAGGSSSRYDRRALSQEARRLVTATGHGRSRATRSLDVDSGDLFSGICSTLTAEFHWKLSSVTGSIREFLHLHGCHCLFKRQTRLVSIVVLVQTLTFYSQPYLIL
ncbi:hypothetical protein JTB14_020441 [Gonioctena quinquepunctata]|nr:hypothetical protein JTB14_020441 [Gonioctena quinquepunctata]